MSDKSIDLKMLEIAKERYGVTKLSELPGGVLETLEKEVEGDW